MFDFHLGTLVGTPVHAWLIQQVKQALSLVKLYQDDQLPYINEIVFQEDKEILS